MYAALTPLLWLAQTGLYGMIVSRFPMPNDEQTNSRLEIAHVLFMDLVGYSKLLVDEQREALHELNRIVRDTSAVQAAEAAGSLVRLPTGDGMALVFTGSLEEPVDCALQISQALRARPSLPLRMGIHSGSVQHVEDVNGRQNIAGGGINIAQRVMDCGDAGHILISKRVADDLAGSRRWAPYLHELGDAEVKHGVLVSVVNFYADVVGNPVRPAKFGGSGARRRKLVRAGGVRFDLSRWFLATGAFVVLTIIVVFVLWRMGGRDRRITPAVQPLPASPTGPAGIPAPAPKEASEKSIAVLPFTNLSTDKDNAFFADGVQDEVLTDLAKIADLKIISRTSVMQYKSDAPRNLREIAAQLGVANVVEGSVQRSGNKIRVTAQLIEARTDTHLWAEHFDRDLSDIFAIQSEIAQAIADQLRARLSPQEKAALKAPPTTDLPAYDLYLRARTLYAASSVAFVHEKLPQAARLLDAAVERDPKFLPAWCLLARIHGDRYFGGDDHTPERLAAATTAVQAAVHLQPDAGETHLALADYYYHGFRDYARARAELDLARVTLPNNSDVYEYAAYIDRRQSHWDKAVHNFGRALELDPRNFSTLQQMALLYQFLHRYEEVDHAYERALAIVPSDPGGRIYRSYVPLEARADIKPFQMTRAALVAEDPRVAPDVDDPNYALCERDPDTAARTLASYPREGYANMGASYPHAYWEGFVARWLGNTAHAQDAFAAARAEVEKMLADKPDSAPALSLLAMIDAGLGRKDQAIEEGRHACEMLPVGKDALAGSVVAVNLAQTLAWTGEKTAAIDQIESIEQGPNLLSYGLLKLHPRWDDLRGDPRFESVVTSVQSSHGY